MTTILVIDDEPSVLRALARTLRPHRVVTANSASEALRLLEAGDAFDLVLSDMMMPGVTGADLHAILEKTHPTLAHDMLFLSGGGTTPATKAFLAANESRVVMKPFDGPVLIACVNATLEKKAR